MTNYVNWPGASGKKYSTEVYKLGTRFKPNPGIYIFCREGSPAGKWAQIYVGECESFKSRLYDDLEQHHRWDCIKRNGGTHVCVMRVDGGKTARLRVETDLREELDPSCNRQ